MPNGGSGTINASPAQQRVSLGNGAGLGSYRERSGSSNGSVRKKRVSRAESRNSNKPRAVEQTVAQQSSATLIEKEESATGAVGYVVYIKYFKGIGLWLGCS